MIQGYRMTDLDCGIAYADILRARWGTSPRLQPLVSVGGVAAWGVPLSKTEVDGVTALLRRWGAAPEVRARFLPVVRR